MSIRKGVVLAGGTGSRLFPLTHHISKQLLPVYDKPMIYYPISTLMNFGVNEILIITQEKFIQNFQLLLKKAHEFNLKISYQIQNEPRGIAEALILAEDFLGNEKSILILGDNILFAPDLKSNIDVNSKSTKYQDNIIFTKKVSNPEDYGVLNFSNDKISNIIEKPREFISNDAVIGLYFYEKNIAQIAKKLEPSKRGELEITDLNNILINENRMSVIKLKDEMLWFDAGTHDSLLECSNFVASVQKRMGRKITKIY